MSVDTSKFGDLSGYNVMMVDDVPINLVLVEKMLKVFNFEIRKASNGAIALEMIQNRKPDLLLLDLMMPVMDGFELLYRIRSDESLSDIKVIVLSALNSNDDIVKAFQLGANDFITKPILMEKLVNAVATQFEIIHFSRR